MTQRKKKENPYYLYLRCESCERREEKLSLSCSMVSE